MFDFDANDTLITSNEVVSFSPVDAHSYVRDRCEFISTKEEKLFNNCFGWEFYVALMNDRWRYGVERQYVNFQGNQAYNVGEFVLFNGTIYEVNQQTDGTQKPTRKDYFKVADKFKKSEYNFLWNRYLKKLLAFAITHTSVMYRLVKDTAKGVVKNYDEGKSRPVSLKELMHLKDEYLGDIDDIIANMEKFIGRNKEHFPNYQFCNPCKRKRKNYGFKLDY